MTEKCTIHRKRGPARARDGSKRGGPARTGWERAGPSQSRGAAAPNRRAHDQRRKDVDFGCALLATSGRMGILLNFLGIAPRTRDRSVAASTQK